MLEGYKPEDVREWYDIGALTLVHTMLPSFLEFSKLPEWISGQYTTYDNPHLKRGDILQLRFTSVTPEIVGKGSDSAFHFIKLQTLDMVAFNKTKAATREVPLLSSISEDNISTRRAWRLWVCLTEMDKVKSPFKILSNKLNRSFILNSMIGSSTKFTESLFKKKIILVWEINMSATKTTRKNICNMLHVVQLHTHICACY
ncbi:UNVERIFIED_CONTAM: hypothetical protein Sangu_3082600 [Sesamum angustifolium]|uniref:Uncharacterized protein n=1 Tax=Sesamum angustifolium TaxID=2727405 RepID=A0AAW2K806_9LAMI